MSLVYQDPSGPVTTTLAAATPAAISPGGSAGIDSMLGGQLVDTYVITVGASGGTLDTIELGFSPAAGSTAFAPFDTTYSVASGDVSSFVVQGFLGNLRVMCTSTAGADAVVSTAVYISAGATPNFALLVNGVVQNTLSLGAALSITSLTTSGAATIGTTMTVTGATALNGAVGLGDAAADAITVTGTMSFAKEQATTLKVNASTTADTAGSALTIQAGAGAATNANGGALTLNAGAKAGSGTNGALALGTSNTSAITAGATGITTTVAGALTVTEAATFNGAVELGNAFADAIDVNGNLRADSGDAGAAATSGTVNKIAGTFTLTSGQTTYTLANTCVASTSHVFASVETAAVGAVFIKRITPTANQAVFEFSGAVGANTLVHFFVVNVAA